MAKELKDNQLIAVKLLVAGVSQAEIARRLEITNICVYQWTKKKQFKEELAFARQYRNEIFREKMEDLSFLVE